MHKYKKENIYNVNIQTLFDIIIDIEKYPEFLPWCCGARIISQESNIIYADLMINFKGLNEQYRSKVTYQNSNLIISEAIQGPFKTLSNKWELSDLGNNKTKLNFMVEFEFKSKILNQLIGFMYTKAIEKLSNAFINRALSYKI